MLHSYLQEQREAIVKWRASRLEKPDPPEANTLLVADNHLDYGIESLVVGLDEIGRRFLIRARAAIKTTFELGVQPFMGGNPIACLENNDDDELDHCWAIAHRTKYLTDLLLDRADNADLRAMMHHLENLIDKTAGLSGPISVSRHNILLLYLWSSVILRDCSGALAATEPHLGKPVTPRTNIRSFGLESAYLRMLCLLGHYANGEDEFRRAAIESLGNLITSHRDYDTIQQRELFWEGIAHDFRWVWLWEVLFCQQPDPTHAIGILRGTEPLDCG
jgi:hypothetical protein